MKMCPNIILRWKTHEARLLHGLSRSKGRLLFSSNTPITPKISQILMERKIVLVYLLA